MPKNGSIVSGIHNLKLALEYFEDFQRQHPGTKGSNLFKNYCSKINWMLKDLCTHPFLPDIVREGIKKEIASDLFVPAAITEKLVLLNPESREAVEQMIDIILDGGEVQITQKINTDESTY